MDRQGHEFQAPKGFGANVPYQDFYRHQQQQQQPQHLQMVLANLYREIQQTTDFKNHSIPLARIKKIMKADKDVRMIAAEAPIVLTRACEMFIFELTRRAWAHAEQNKRRTLQKNDIAAVLTKTNMYDFLAEIENHNSEAEAVVAINNRDNPMQKNQQKAIRTPPASIPADEPGCLRGRPRLMEADLGHHTAERMMLPGGDEDEDGDYDDEWPLG
ncbi:Nuclear transcription factor Y subunit C-3 [Dendrobium catenatum]|uniref:Nuclear transcription factor Y subunit C-3 n=1 Tax=Dendrobium catenatum TaxID=906689 RepID=A0A2I0WCL0_9ASPA|nr:Nuclear transcription factor Y subunit C-3 [Dendrobium catenatum]